MLKLRYAPAGKPAFTPAKARSLAPDFQFLRYGLEDVSKWSSLGGLVWLDLGHVTIGGLPHEALHTLGALQPEAKEPSMIVISGYAPTGLHHRNLVSAVYSVFPHPERVDVDFSGRPDLLAAIEKFRRISDAPRTKPDVNVPAIAALPNSDLHAKSGRLSADLIRKVFGVTLTELCSWIGRKKAAVSKTPDAPSLQEALSVFARIALVRKMLGQEQDFRVWLNTDLPLLEGKSPLHWIRQGKAVEIAEFVWDSLSGQPT